MKKILGTIVIAFCTSLLTFAIAKNYSAKNSWETVEPNPNSSTSHTTGDQESPASDGVGYINLEEAAERSSRVVVHIKTETRARAVQYQNPFGDDFFNRFFGGQPFMQQGPQQSSGSGVIVSSDGYIVTNNHVVDGADEVTVILNNKKTLPAKVIGKDASTDLAVLKVDESNLPFASFGNSDDVKLGQWVLAVGYPLTLETTVTAGIVSAKYRNIGINQSKSGSGAIESFIQTDAAVNPGNSGGALVNARGELIGINSAIASPTGSYAGYSFAIPSNIVRKVIDDMVKFGNVQRAYLGVGYLDSKNASPEELSAYKLDKIDGIYVSQVMEKSSAEDAGIKVGDIITRIGNKEVKTGPQMIEKIATYRPGETVNVNVLRNGKDILTQVKLKNALGNTKVLTRDPLSKEKLGLNMRELNSRENAQLRIDGGIYINGILSNGLVARQTNMRRGFIITEVNEKPVRTIKELEKALTSEDKEFQFGGVYPNYQGSYYYTIQPE
jgi:serine protease Do